METQHHDPVDEPTCLSRRSFFKTAAAATVATAAGAALAGCAPSTELAPTGSGDNAEREAFEAAAAPIEPVTPPDAWDEEVDVVVVGSGGGGITGSVRLADAGKQVILLEKNEKTGGTTS